MDKYIKLLLIKLSTKYKITLINFMNYDDEKQRFKNRFNLRIVNRQTDEAAEIRPIYGKQAVINELMQWLE